MANIRLKQGQVDPKNPHATSVAGPKALKTVDINNVNIVSSKAAKKSPLETFIVSQAPEEVANPLSEILDYAYEIEVYNYSEAAKQDFITLEKVLSKPKYMIGNCNSVTDSLLENISEDDFPEGYQYDRIQLDYNNGVHVAVKATDAEGVEWIVDYTTRQYDATLPQPLVARVDEWESLIDHYVETLHGDSRKL